jgi:hypothetical protein
LLSLGRFPHQRATFQLLEHARCLPSRTTEAPGDALDVVAVLQHSDLKQGALDADHREAGDARVCVELDVDRRRAVVGHHVSPRVGDLRDGLRG